MATSSTILAIIEPDTHPHEVVDRAVWLADLNNCSLDILLCDPDIETLGEGWFVTDETREIFESVRLAQSEMIEELADSVRNKGVLVNSSVLEERPIAEGIVQAVEKLNPRFLMKGTHYHSAAERSIFIDTDWQLIRSCACPLYLVKPDKVRDNPLVLAAVDPTQSHDKPAALDQIIIDNAKNIAEKCNGEVHLVHTYQRLAGIGSEATRTFKPIKLPVDAIDKKIQAQHREKLDALADANHLDADHVHQLPGKTRETLPAFARAYKVDIVVMGAVARRGLKRMVIGSTVERVLDHLPCDILIVRDTET